MSVKNLEIEDLRKAHDVAGLRAILSDDEVRASKGLRSAVAQALRALRSSEALPTLVDLVDDGHLPVRMVAVKALGEIGDADAISRLSDCLMSNDARGVRSSAATALGAIGGAQAIEVLISHGLPDTEVAVRMMAARALGDLMARDALTPLCGALCDESRQVRVNAAIALVKIRDERAFGPLRRFWDHASRLQRWEIKKALTMTGLAFPGSG